MALKVLRPELAAAIGAVRFLNEIRVTASLQHPHILPLHDSGEADGFLFYVMPYVEGESLRDCLNRERQLPIDDALRIATEVAAALSYAHGRGVIHRETGPAVPVPVLERVAIALLGSAKLAFSRNGWAVYMEGGTRQRRLTLVDRRGARSAIPTDALAYNDPRFSPNGKDAALTVVQPGGGLAGDIRVLNVARATMSRLTVNEANEYADWSADGRRVLYTTLRGANGLYWKSAGGGTAQSLFKGPGQQLFSAFLTHDEKRIIFRLHGLPADLYHVHRDSTDTPHALIDSPADERSAAISPDDAWIAYVSNETGRDEVYVRSFPDGGGHTPVSPAGGTEPRWSRDGRELFYRNADTLFAVPVQTQPTFSVGAPVALFIGAFFQNPRHAAYDVHPDGQRFIFITDDANDFGELMLVQNVVAAVTRSPTAPPRR